VPCPVLHRIAFPVVSEWYQHRPSVRVACRPCLGSSNKSTEEPLRCLQWGSGSLCRLPQCPPSLGFPQTSVSARRARHTPKRQPDILEGGICIKQLLNRLRPHSTVMMRVWVVEELLSYASEVAGGKLEGKLMVPYGARERFGGVAQARRALRGTRAASNLIRLDFIR
jgi:hypothetical protein